MKNNCSTLYNLSLRVFAIITEVISCYPLTMYMYAQRCKGVLLFGIVLFWGTQNSQFPEVNRVGHMISISYFKVIVHCCFILILVRVQLARPIVRSIFLFN